MIVPIVLSGGVGSRLWPSSRRDLAKQLVPLLGDQTLFQLTLSRFADRSRYARPVVVSGEGQRFVVRDQAEELGIDIDLVLEPEPRDTLAAIAAAAGFARDRDGDPVVLVAPSDHLVPDVAAFGEAVSVAGAAALTGRIVTFGVKPNRPATGYGYIRPGAEIGEGARQIAAFVEKPDADKAETLIAEGCLWNAGLFCFQARVGLEEAAAQRPDVVRQVERALAEKTEDLGAYRLGPSFSKAEKVSFDIAVMENTQRAAVAPAAFPWSDIGDWHELWNQTKDAETGHAVQGDVVLEDCENVLAHGGDRLVCALGVKDVVIVDTPDAILVADRAKSQQVKQLVSTLADRGRPEATSHARVHRPWGWYQTMDLGDRFRVKRINVSPDRKLSLQRHHHRAEHWVVVKGTAEVTIDDEVTLLRENESIYIPMGAVHRLANPGKIPVEIIEVQTGAYLEEDDIIRIQDDFGRDASAPKG